MFSFLIDRVIFMTLEVPLLLSNCCHVGETLVRFGEIQTPFLRFLAVPQGDSKVRMTRPIESPANGHLWGLVRLFINFY